MKVLWLIFLFCLCSCQADKDTWVVLENGQRLQLAHSETASTVILSEPPSLDWLVSSDTDSSWIEEHIMDGLVGFDLSQPGLKLIPALATHWQSSANGKVWTFKIRDQVLWSDGMKLKAQHFVDAIKRILDPSVAALAVDNVFPIKGAQDYNLGKIKDFTQVGVRALDDLTLEFRLKEPMSFFPMILTHHTTFPIRQDVIDKHQERWTEPENIVTLGPYKLIYWHHDSRLVLSRYENYWDGPPAIKNIIFYMVGKDATMLRMFERGKIDLIRDLPSSEIPRLSQKKEFYSSPGLRLYYYGIKVNKKPFDNLAFRKAVAHAIDRDQIVKVLGGGQTPLKSWIPSGLFGHDSQVGLSFDVNLAKKYLQQASISQASLSSITLGFNTEEKHKRVAENIQAQLKKNLGLSIELKNEEWKTFLSGLRSESAYSMFRLGWVADYADPHNFMAILTSFTANNRTGWKNQDYDKLVSQALREQDSQKRLKLYHQAQKILVEKEIPVIPLFTDVNQVLVSQRIKKFRSNVLDIYHFHTMEIGP